MIVSVARVTVGAWKKYGSKRNGVWEEGTKRERTALEKSPSFPSFFYLLTWEETQAFDSPSVLRQAKDFDMQITTFSKIVRKKTQQFFIVVSIKIRPLINLLTCKNLYLRLEKYPIFRFSPRLLRV